VTWDGWDLWDGWNAACDFLSPVGSLRTLQIPLTLRTLLAKLRRPTSKAACRAAQTASIDEKGF